MKVRAALTTRSAACAVLAAALATAVGGSAFAQAKKTVPTAKQSDAVKLGIPASGKGSLAGMARDRAATAASNNPQLSTLVAAVSAAGLVETLNGPGPFTIFAPANGAFSKLPAGSVESLIKPENKPTLSSILTYHVVAGRKLSSADLSKMRTVQTVNGETLSLRVTGRTLTLNGSSKVALADVQVANGTVHIIDSVVMPKTPAPALPAASEADAAAVGVPASGPGSLVEMAKLPAANAASSNAALKTLVAAVGAAGLVDTLNGAGPFTVFAPVNAAFDKLPAGTVDTLLKPENKARLTAVLTFHVVAGKLSSADLAKAGSVDTLNGAKLTFSASGKTVSINGSAKTILADIHVANGTVHLIDGVLLPACRRGVAPGLTLTC